ncbi:MAG: hypothetical protein KDC38_13880 [Planctomycetes bacterium]|nr:hypothetical protein [Planctomycetota bacterium]
MTPTIPRRPISPLSSDRPELYGRLRRLDARLPDDGMIGFVAFGIGLLVTGAVWLLQDGTRAEKAELPLFVGFNAVLMMGPFLHHLLRTIAERRVRGAIETAVRSFGGRDAILGAAAGDEGLARLCSTAARWAIREPYAGGASTGAPLLRDAAPGLLGFAIRIDQQVGAPFDARVWPGPFVLVPVFGLVCLGWSTPLEALWIEVGSALCVFLVLLAVSLRRFRARICALREALDRAGFTERDLHLELVALDVASHLRRFLEARRVFRRL